MKELLKYCKEHLAYDPATGIITRIKTGYQSGSIGTNGYRTIRIKGKNYYAHRIAYLMHYNKMPDRIDHCNQCRSDNRIINLRSCSHAENLRNVGPSKRNKSGYKGVVWHKTGGKWLAQLVYNGKNIYLGLHICKHEAARHYNLAARMYHGNFAYTNIITS